MDWWRASTSMRCGLATFGSRVLVRSVPAVRPLIYLLILTLRLKERACLVPSWPRF